MSVCVQPGEQTPNRADRTQHRCEGMGQCGGQEGAGGYPGAPTLATKSRTPRSAGAEGRGLPSPTLSLTRPAGCSRDGWGMAVLGQGPRGDTPPRIQTRNRHENTLSCTGGQGKAKLATAGPSAFGRHSSPNTGEGVVTCPGAQDEEIAPSR